MRWVVMDYTLKIAIHVVSIGGKRVATMAVFACETTGSLAVSGKKEMADAGRRG